VGKKRVKDAEKPTVFICEKERKPYKNRVLFLTSYIFFDGFLSGFLSFSTLKTAGAFFTRFLSTVKEPPVSTTLCGTLLVLWILRCAHLPPVPVTCHL
jgi:hypothetical protein